MRVRPSIRTFTAAGFLSMATLLGAGSAAVATASPAMNHNVERNATLAAEKNAAPAGGPSGRRVSRHVQDRNCAARPG